VKLTVELTNIKTLILNDTKDILNQYLNLSIEIRRVKMRENMISYKLKSYLS